MKQCHIMSNEELMKFYIAVLEIAAFERGKRRQAQEMIKRIKAEMLRRGM